LFWTERDRGYERYARGLIAEEIVAERYRRMGYEVHNLNEELSSNLPGIPDLLALDRRRHIAIFIEIKSGRARLSEYQEAIMKNGKDILLWLARQYDPYVREIRVTVERVTDSDLRDYFQSSF